MQWVDNLLQKTADKMAARRRLPESTYRIQFHAGFTFQQARQIVPYLSDLGVTDCYASPYLKAKPGSTHGYDVIDHHHLNPELGTEADFHAWVEAMRACGMGHVLDIVPNHVGVATNDNPWWNDVLERGPGSKYAAYFDIAWRGALRPELHDKMLLPVLGELYGKVLEAGQLRLAFEEGKFSVTYYERQFPIASHSAARVLRHRPEQLSRRLTGSSLDAYKEIIAAFEKGDTDAARRSLRELVAADERVRLFFDENVAAFNGDISDPRSFDLLDELLNEQFYRLAFWQVASDEINYRRFFDVNDLAALSMERLAVLESTHELILRLLGEGKIDGLRIDHPDGLYDPRQYFERLQQHYLLAVAEAVFKKDAEFADRDWADVRPAVLARVEGMGAGGIEPRLYVVAEKILAPDEPLPGDWPVHGTSGYDFLNVVNGLFINSANEQAFTRLYDEWTGQKNDFEELVYRKKLLILDTSLASELQMLAHQLDRIAQRNRHSRDFTHNALRLALRQVIAAFPVYRAYVSDRGVSERDRQYTAEAIDAAKRRSPKTPPVIYDFIKDVLLLEHPARSNEQDRAERQRFAGKFQQVTSPVTAKGIEDTAFYVYQRLVSLNEVGGSPERFGISPDDAHRYLLDRQQRWLYSMSTLSTHDTKRSEDVRARINVLSELPEQWAKRVAVWSQLNEQHRGGPSRSAPAADEEYLLYQTLIGAWPLEPGPVGESFISRVQAYMVKAMREAKLRTSWTQPDDAHEAAVQQFVADILDPAKAADFLHDFEPFQRRISRLGLINSLSQTLLKLTSPGVPDTYQGTELWDFSLVDPDNRRPIVYDRRRLMLDQLKSKTDAAGENRLDLARELMAEMENGAAKLYLTWQALTCRRENPGLFSVGDYKPLRVEGHGRDHLFGFIRRHKRHVAVVAVPRLLVALVGEEFRMPLGAEIWQDTRLDLPPDLGPLRDRFTGVTVNADRGIVPVADWLAAFPVGLLLAGAEAADQSPAP